MQDKQKLLDLIHSDNKARALELVRKVGEVKAMGIMQFASDVTDVIDERNMSAEYALEGLRFMVASISNGMQLAASGRN